MDNVKLLNELFSSELPNVSVEEKNEIFHNMTPEQQRKEISIDVLTLLFTETTRGSFGMYWDMELIDAEANTSLEFQQKLLEIDIKNNSICSVCARGAAMLSIIRLGNRISPEDEYRSKGHPHNIVGFSYKEFKEMENLYEGATFFARHHPYSHYTTKLLMNIYLNVLHNKSFVMADYTDYLAEYGFKVA